MTFEFGQRIEYEDGTRDLNLEAARKWARENGVSFEEDIEARFKKKGKLMRVFVIGDKPPVIETPTPPPQPEPEIHTMDKATEVRMMRDMRLSASDWTQIPDSPLTDEQKAAYAVYRQELRDLPAQAGFPEDVEWPEEPTLK